MIYGSICRLIDGECMRATSDARYLGQCKMHVVRTCRESALAAAAGLNAPRRLIQKQQNT